MDIQPVFNEYKTITYIAKYITKSEDQCSKAMKQALKEAIDLNMNKFEQMVKIGKAYSNNRECSAQEAIYHIMPELWMKKSFPVVEFINTNLPEDRFRMCKSKKELSELPEDSEDIFKSNMLDKYIDRPNSNFKGGKYSIVNDMCYAEFFFLPLLLDCL